MFNALKQFRKKRRRLKKYKADKMVKSLKKLFGEYGVDTIFDIGANIGISGEFYRDIGFKDKIVSFEPIGYLFDDLKKASAQDSLWIAENLALGEVAGETEINVSGGHAGSSSLLSMTDNLITHAPHQRVVRKEKIRISTLDEAIRKHYPVGDRLFLKIDTQGFEKKVLQGGLPSLDRVVGMKVELSFVENYHGEPLFFDMLNFIEGLGFKLVYIENGWSHPLTRQLFQVDGIFFRPEKTSRTTPY